MVAEQRPAWGRIVLAALVGGVAAGAGDSLLACLLYRAPLPAIYRAVASGLLGAAARQGGASAAALGGVLHFFIATVAALAYVAAATLEPRLLRQAVPWGLAHGVGVYLFMKYLVLPLSAVPRLTPFDPAAMAGHAFLVGLPIALAARRVLGRHHAEVA